MHPLTRCPPVPAACCPPSPPARADIRIMDTLKEILPQNWGLRIAKTLDRTFSSASLALATI